VAWDVLEAREMAELDEDRNGEEFLGRLCSFGE
jgi:hypothetical protein